MEEAADGEEGLRKFKDKEYDVILCDIKMPKIDGIEFLEKAKELSTSRIIPNQGQVMISYDCLNSVF